MTPGANNPCRTRADLQALVVEIVRPLLPFLSPGRARLRLGPNHAWYGEPAEALEGFSRPLWGLAPLLAGGGVFPEISFWRQGLASGSNPDHPEYWGRAMDRDQRIVEMAGLALGLLLAPEHLWEPLPPPDRSHLACWLSRVNEVSPVDSNWRLFRVLVNLALRRLGLPFSEANLHEDTARIDQFHLGGGWYSDGPKGPNLRDGRVGDYYVPMGMHFYGLLYAVFERERDPYRAKDYTSRAAAFAGDFAHWFAADGAALPFGRSLTYRFAMGAFWGSLAFAGVEALPWGVLKGLYLRHLRWWMAQPIFSEAGLLSIGYGYPNLVMAESYNSPGSPYWALKFFLPLALPEEHPFWAAEEAPVPGHIKVRTIPGASLVICRHEPGGEVRALAPGQAVEDWPRHAGWKYSKFAYSTRFGFSVPCGAPSLEEGGFDSMLALSDDGRRFRGRDHALDPEVRDAVAFSRWLPWRDISVETWLVATREGHLCIHRVVTPRELIAAECGFALRFDDRATVSRVLLESCAEVRSPFGHSSVVDLGGDRKPDLVDLGPNSHLLYSLAIMPVLRGTIRAGETWLAAWVSAGDLAPTGEAHAFQVEFASEGCRVTRGGAGYWSTSGPGCGTSGAERLQELGLGMDP